MKLTLSEPKFLKDSISIISDLVTEATFKITKDAIELVAMDPANVAMVIFKLLSSSFVEYDVKENEVWRCIAGIDKHYTTRVAGDKPRILLSFGYFIDLKTVKKWQNEQ